MNESEKKQKIDELRERIKDVETPWCTDDCLDRYLRAREYNLEKAESMLRATLQWRAERKPEEIKPESITHVKESMGMYSIGRGKNGEPICYIVPQPINPGNYEERMNYLIHTMETVIKRMPKGVEKMIWIMDFENFGERARDETSKQVSRNSLHVLQNHYPERLAHFFMMNQPWYFTAIWWVVSWFIDSKTREKIHFLSGSKEDKLKVLMQYIDKSQIDKKYGGDLEITDEMKKNWDVIEEPSNEQKM